MAQILTRKTRERAALTNDELARTREIGERLRAELLGLLENVPAGVRRTRALGRHLAVDRNTCHRILAATQQRAEDGLRVIAKLPGIAALRQFVDAVETAGARTNDLKAASAAIDQLAKLIEEVGGSLLALQQRCAATPVPDEPAPSNSLHSDEMRKRLFESAADMVGRCLDAHLLITIVRPVPSDPRLWEHVGVNALIGHRQLKPEAMPLVLTYSYTDSEAVLGEPEYGELARNGRGQELLKKFSTQPFPIVTSRDGRKAHQQYVIDADVSGKKIDIVTGCRMDPVPRTSDQEVPVFHNVLRIRYPAVRLVFDVYMHRSLAMSSVPTTGVYSWHPNMVDNLSKFWHERVPIPLRMEMLGPSIHNAQTDAWGRHQELTHYTFQQLGWNGDDFVGYRVTQMYPAWNLYYYLSWDFAPTSSLL